MAECARLAGVRGASGGARLTRPPHYKSVHRRQSCARVGNPGWLGSDSCEANAQRTRRLPSEVSFERTAGIFVLVATLGWVRQRMGIDQAEGRDSRNGFQ